MAKKARKTAKRSAKRAATPKRGPSLRGDSIPRAILGRELQRQITKFGLGRGTAAAIVDEAASQMSRLMTGHIAEFSADRLVKMMTRLGSEVTIVIRRPRTLGRRGRVRVKIA
ncbi:MAG: XRE family transcriptional regulator [Gemmatimonadaceae bacterium]